MDLAPSRPQHCWACEGTSIRLWAALTRADDAALAARAVCGPTLKRPALSWLSGCGLRWALQGGAVSLPLLVFGMARLRSRRALCQRTAVRTLLATYAVLLSLSLEGLAALLPHTCLAPLASGLVIPCLLRLATLGLPEQKRDALRPISVGFFEAGDVFSVVFLSTFHFCLR